MLALPDLTAWPAWLTALLDASLLTALLAPLIYVVAFRPLRDALQQSEVAQMGMQRQRAELEAEVRERTRQLDEALARVRAASDAKTDFLAGMSHELRTPLNAIMGYAQLLGQRDTLGEYAREEVQQIQLASEHLLFLINGVVDLARIEAGALALSIETVSVLAAARQAMALARPLAQQAQVELLDQSNEAGDTKVRADHSRLVQVLLNYLSNGIKYNKPGGRVCLRVEASDSLVRIWVEDTGHGIPPERHHQVFQAAFERFGREFSKTDGVGIGLVIVQRIVTSMGGDVGFESRPGEGSRFWVSLPREHGTLPLRAAPSDASSGSNAQLSLHRTQSGRAARILLAEDNAMNRQVAQAMLLRMGYQSEWVEDGASAVDAACSGRFDLVLMDCQMPRLDGYQAARGIRLREAALAPGGRRIPILAMTANALHGDREACLAAGMDDYVSKPLDLQKLAALLAKWLPAPSTEAKAAPSSPPGTAPPS